MENSKQATNDKQPKRAVGLRRILTWFYVACALVLGLDFVIHRHTYHPWENLLFFYCVFGFVACVILVVVAKWMRVYLMRSEEYYDND